MILSLTQVCYSNYDTDAFQIFEVESKIKTWFYENGDWQILDIAIKVMEAEPILLLSSLLPIEHLFTHCHFYIISNSNSHTLSAEWRKFLRYLF